MRRAHPRRDQLSVQNARQLFSKTTRLQATALLLVITSVILLGARFVATNRGTCSANPRQAHCPHPVACRDHAHDIEVPRALVVISAGASRASSTVLYNALRILLRIRDPNTVAGWYVDLMHLYDSYAKPMVRNGSVANMAEASRVDAFKALGSVLIKVHTVRDWHVFLGGGNIEPAMEGVADAVFVTHRDVRQSVRSIRDMGWGVRVSEAQRAHPDFCRKKLSDEPKKYLMVEDFEQEGTWVNLARTQLRCREVMLQTAGSKLAEDLRSEDMARAMKGNLTALLRQLGSHLDFDYSDAMLAMAARELSLLRPVACDSGYDAEMSVNPLTHMHKAHTRAVSTSAEGREALDAIDRRGAAAIERDSLCGAWLRSFAYV